MANKEKRYSRNTKKQKGFHAKHKEPTDYQRERDSQVGRHRRKGLPREEV